MGPLLFQIYIIDLPHGITSSARLFADDCILYRAIRNITDYIALQSDLDWLVIWEMTWQMHFNVTKCYSMSISHKKTKTFYNYTMRQSTLETIHNYPYLCVIISDDLSWTNEVNKVKSKANRTLGMLCGYMWSCKS